MSTQSSSSNVATSIVTEKLLYALLEDFCEERDRYIELIKRRKVIRSLLKASELKLQFLDQFLAEEGIDIDNARLLGQASDL